MEEKFLDMIVDTSSESIDCDFYIPGRLAGKYKAYVNGETMSFLKAVLIYYRLGFSFSGKWICFGGSGTIKFKLSDETDTFLAKASLLYR